MNYPRYESIKRYYDKNCYSNEDIAFYTKHGALTPEQYKEITNEEYPESQDE
ncbi:MULTISPECIES: XkdX family protein [Staphylococcus]|uniref:XkdX family protein n=1 Tax=Staphylococcus TaxID=1279 RepID=UPI000D1E7055|nr:MULTISPECIES: XkdX family protein [Staphylococcus]MBM2659695.1 XkdX family protein [Staphylococcus pseudoxylosus]MCQ3816719.1 XkdX family protein [Staphylococcus xylosus]MCQ3819227.1 XkdX family protein [Staphylococcus xylosus]PTI80856.1 XkdX family protein [Staphylococcus xylosus]UBV36654.1 XkdX family protein [Staphylococcus xylosus]